MRHFDESEKPARKEALSNLLKVMGGLAAGKLQGLKKKPVAAEMSVTALPKDGAGDEHDMHGEPDGDEGDCPHCGKPY